MPRKQSKKTKATQSLPPFTRTLRFTADARSVSSRRPEALVVYLFEGARQVSTLPDGKLRQALDGLIRSEGFRGKRGGTLVFHSAGRFPARRIILAGLGPKGRYDLEAIRQGAAAAAGRAATSTARTVTFTLPPELPGGEEGVADRVRATADGFLLGTYRMRKYLTGESRKEASALRSGEILVPSAHLRQARGSARLASAACRVTNLARDLVNEPAASLTPVKMAEYARALAGGAGLECRVHDEKDLDKLGMGAFLGVARGSHQPPRMIHLVYRPKGKPARKVALVGKGLTFDSGGLSLKTSTGMETMKLDKSGAVTVLATMLGLGETRPEVEVHGLLGMAENMPGGSAMKPGDVVRTCGGKTVEVLNTDAEGRLVLADVLGYARTLGVDEIIDLATLTGAVMIALGPMATGLFTDNDDLARGLLEASERCGEKTWHLPMYDEYKDQLRSQIADLKNTAERYGGAITAAMFLREFAGRETRWAHLDIAGPAFLETSRHPYLRRGGTGAGVRTLLTYLSSISGRA